MERTLIRLAHNSRFIYNQLLATSIEWRQSNNGKRPGLKEIRSFLSIYRGKVKAGTLCNRDGEIYPDDFIDSLRSTPSQIGDMTAEDLFRAWKTVSFPKSPAFKKKGISKLSFTIHRKVDSTFRLSDNILTFSKISMKLHKLRFIKDSSDIRRITISKTAQGWYISLLTSIPKSTFRCEQTGAMIGIDWGVKDFATDSDGKKKSFRTMQGYTRYVRLAKLLRELQSILSKKRLANKEWKSSKRYQKLKGKIACIHEKLANIRKNFIHHVSRYYADNFSVINIEDLKPRNMLQNHKLARAISESMFYTWKVTLGYKVERAGGKLNLVNPRNTSQTCSCCNAIRPIKLKLSERTFTCGNCGYREDRDVNAAINILHA